MTNKIESETETKPIPAEYATPNYQNPLPCGCAMLGTPYLDVLGTDGYRYKDRFIRFCSLHAAAPALYAAVQELIATTFHHSWAHVENDDCSCKECAVKRGNSALALAGSQATSGFPA